MPGSLEIAVHLLFLPIVKFFLVKTILCCLMKIFLEPLGSHIEITNNADGG